MSALVVETLTAPPSDVVDFLGRSEGASIFHGKSWATVLARSYGHETFFFVARSGSSVRGVFVAVRQRLWPLREKWVAMPYQFQAGAPVAEDEATAAALVRAALSAARSARALYLEIRSSRFAHVMMSEGLERVDTGLQATNLDLSTHRPDMIRKTIRKELRRAASWGVVTGSVPAPEGMKTFLSPYLRDMRDLGTPQAGTAFFDALLREMPDAVHIVVARREGQVLGSMLVLGDQRAAFARGSAGTMTPEARELNVGKALLHAAIEAAQQRGVRMLHLGITWEGNPGLNAYKEGWGGTTEPVEAFVAAISGKAPKAGDYFGSFQLARRLWGRMPMILAEPVGHRITRWIG